MDETRVPNPGGTFEPTPEATPISDQTPVPVASAGTGGPGATSDAQGGTAATGQTGGEGGDFAHDLAERLKPVAAAAEEVAARAVDLSSKGLEKVASFLEERRRQRGGDGGPPGGEGSA
jgi:hypothetical protein